jgi:staphylococcal nuclease domain-containing protein 1
MVGSLTSLAKLGVLSFPAIVESVRDATTLRVRLLMPEGEHQFVNVTLAGARSPRAASKQGETSEPWADEVSHIRLLMRSVAN